MGGRFDSGRTDRPEASGRPAEARNRAKIAEVHLEIGASQPRHIYDASEQIWYAAQGGGKFLLADNQEKDFKSGGTRITDSLE